MTLAYTSLITFHVAPGRSAEFEAAFEQTGMLTRPQEVAGFRGAELLRGTDDPDTYIVLGTWDSVDAYREWQDRSAQDVPGLAELLDTLRDLRAGQLFHPAAQSSQEAPGSQTRR